MIQMVNKSTLVPICNIRQREPKLREKWI